MPRIPRFFAVLALLFLTPFAATADGIAIVQAPEQSSGVCVGKNAGEAFACATQHCVAGGAAAEDCMEMTYCDTGWSVDVFMQSKEGNHWHEFHCGWRTRHEAEAAGKLACNRTRMKELMGCAAVQFYDPEGKPQLEN